MTTPAVKPTMHVMGRAAPRSEADIIADQVAVILAKRDAANNAANPDTWTAIDAAKISVQAAESSKKYWSSVTSTIGDFQSAIDMMSMEIKTLRRQCAALTSENASLRNTAMLCGIGAAVVSGFVVALIVAPNIGASQVQPDQTITPQITRGAGG